MVTSWTDKYTTVIYSPKQLSIPRREIQPLPDYKRWLKTSELHYMPYEERRNLKSGPWDDTAGLFLPTTILDLCYVLAEDVPPNVLTAIAMLAWIPLLEVKEYYSRAKRRLEETAKNDEERERWKSHTLYCTKTKSQLEELCKKKNIPVTQALNKHHLVRLISENMGEHHPPLKDASTKVNSQIYLLHHHPFLN